MEIALLGDTGDIGKGLALRWARDTDHTIVIGSRNAEKAKRKADEYNTLLADHGVDATILGTSNEEAVLNVTVAVLSVPPEYTVDTVDSIAPHLDDDIVLISPAVPMQRDEAGFHYDSPSTASIAELTADAVPDEVPVVGAFQNLAAGALSELDNEFVADVIVTGDDSDAKTIVKSLAEEIDGLRALDGAHLLSQHSSKASRRS